MSRTISADTYTSGITLASGDNPVTVTSIGVVKNTANTKAAIYGPVGTTFTLANYGTISESGTNGRGVSLASGGTITNAATGLISAAGAIRISAAYGSVTNLGTIISTSGVGIYSQDGGAVTNAAGATISGNSGGVSVQTDSGVVINLGLITEAATATTGNAISLASGGNIVNGQAGSGTSTASLRGVSDGVLVQTAGAAVTNYGTITGTKIDGVVLNAGGMVFNGQSGATAALIQGASYGIYLRTGSIANYGTISGTGTASDGIVVLAATISNLGSASLIQGHAGISIRSAGTVTNAGTIAANSASGTAIAFGTGTNRLIIDPRAVFIGTVSAAGSTTIELASGTSAGTVSGLGAQYTGFTSIAVDAAAAWTLASGSVTAGYAINDAGTLTNAATLDATVTLGSGAVLTNASGGTISGYDGVIGQAGAVTVVNTGAILGNLTGTAADGIYLGAGGSVTNQAGGVITGGSNAISETDGTLTVANAGRLMGGRYGILMDGGGSLTNASTGFIFGATAIDARLYVPVTIANAGTIKGSSISGKGIYLTTGGTITNQLGGIISAQIGVFAAIEAPTVVNAGSIGGYSGTSGGIGVYLETGGSLTNQSGGTISGYRAIQGGEDPTPVPITVVNTGAIIGNLTSSGGAGVLLEAGGSVTNQFGGTISGYFGITASGAPATVVNAGVIAGNYTSNYNNADGVYLSAGGTVTNQASGNIYGRNDGVLISGAPGTVLNLGTIHSRVDATYGRSGIYLAAGGVIINGASGAGTASTATILGYNYAVQFGATGTDTLTNYGTINGSPGTVAVSMYTGTLTNGASGAIGALIESGLQSSAVLISGAGTVVNYGSITGLAANGESHVSYGVSLGASGTVASSIRNLGSNALISGYVAVYAVQNATVTNGGTMEATQEFGGTPPIEAVIFGGGTNRLIVDPGAVFIGGVNGSGAFTLAPGGQTTILGTANGVGTTTLELASATAAGTLSGLGTQYAGFAAVTIDASANWTFSGSNTLAAGITLTDSGTLTTNGTFTNAGLVTGAAKGVVLTTGARVTNQAGGTITGSAFGISASGAATLVNAGVISGNASVTADAGVSFAAGGSVTNQSGGTITGDNAVYDAIGPLTLTNAGSIGGTADGVKLTTSGTITNQSGGTITGYRAIYLRGGSATVVNAGSLGGSSAPTYGAGINVSHGGAVTNLSGGVITGHHAIYATIVALTVTNAGSIGGNAVNGTGVDLLFGGTITNQTGGAISGGTDAVKFAAGHTNRLVIDPGAAFTGTVTGGNTIGAASISTLELASGASAGTLSGLGAQYINFAQVAIDAGATWMLSGSQTGFAKLSNAGTVTGGVTLGAGSFSVTNQSSGTITGTTGIAFGAASSGTLIDSGTIIGTGGTAVSFGSGTNLMQLQPGNLRIQGVVLGAGTSTLEFASGATTGTLTGVGANFSGFSQGTVDAGASWVLAGANGFAGTPLTDAGTLSNTGSLVVGPQLGVTGTFLNTGLVGASGSIAVSVASGGVVGNSGTGAITGTIGSYGSYVAGAAGGTGLYLSGGGVTNAATISGGTGGASNQQAGAGGHGVDVIGGSLTNIAHGTITGGVGGLGVYVYSYTNGSNYGVGGTGGTGITVLGASVTNATLATIVGGVGGSAPDTAGRGGVGVDVAGGSLTNQGIIGGGGGGGLTGIGNGVAGGYGVVLTSGSITNQGTITGGGGGVGGGGVGGGELGSGGGGGGVAVGGGSLTNTTLATIMGGAGGSETGFIFNNTARGGTGVDINGGVVTNQGTVAGGTGVGRLGYGGYGANVGAGTLIDAGVIAGGFGTNSSGTIVRGDAVFFGGAGRLIADPGASFVGAVVGDAAASDVLELASGSAGSLAGFGTSITNFASLVFDTGAQWTVAGDASANGLGTVGISGFTFGDTIDLAGFAATSETFASNALVLTAGTAHETVHIQGSFATGNFALTNVGSTATDITFQTDPLLYGATIDAAGTIAAETVAGGVMTLFNGGGTAVGTIVVGASLSSGDFILRPDGSGGTDVVLDTVFGSYSSGVTLLVNPTTIASTAIVDNTAASGVAVSGPGGTSWMLTNLGSVAETGTGAGVGIAFAVAGTIINSGHISGNATVSGGVGISLAAGGVVTNLVGGVISGDAGVVFGAASSGSLIDSGTITSTGTGGTAVSFGSGTNLMQLQPGNLRIQGVVLGGAGTSTLEFASSATTGTLTGVGANFSGFSQGTVDAGAKWLLAGGNSFAGTPLTDAGTLSNSGSLLLGPQLSVAGTFLNTGSVSAGGSIAVSVASGGVVGNSGSGAITGAAGSYNHAAGGTGGIGVYLSSGGVTNAAAITGGTGGGSYVQGGAGGVAVAVSGGSLTNTTGGTIAGGAAIYSHTDGGAGGAGVDLSGGSVTNAAAIIGGLGGAGGALNGGGGGVGVAVSGGSLTNTTGGTIAGGGGSFGHLAGGTGGTGVYLSSVGVSNAALITGGRGGDSQFGPAGDGGAGVAVVSGSLTNTVGGTIAGGLGGGGQVSGGVGGAGVSVLGGSLTNTAGGTIAGGVGGVGQQSGGAGGVGVSMLSGSVTNTTVATIIGGAGGTMDQAGVGGAGVEVAGGSLTNQGTISGGGGGAAEINGVAGGYGVVLTSGSITNQATITGGSGGGSSAYYSYDHYIGGNGGGGAKVSGGSLTNATLASIIGGVGGVGSTADGGFGGVGIAVNAGSVINQGTIIGGAGNSANGGYANGGGNGVDLNGGVVTNHNTIAGGTGLGDAGFGGVGVYVQAGTLIDSGVIDGGTGTNATGTVGIADAVLFTGAGRLILDPGASFGGAVVGDAASSDVLELASGSSADTLSGLGAHYVGFGQVTIDTGANWTLGGGDTVASGVTLANSGTLTGNILHLSGASLTNQAGGVVSASYVYGVVTGGADSVVNAGTITSGANTAIYLKAAGNVSNAAGAVISGYGGVKLRGTDATLGNLGLVTATAAASTGYGAYLRNGGRVTNGLAGAGTSTASIEGYTGLAFKAVEAGNAYGTLANYGTVIGTGTEASGVLLSNTGTVFNGQSGATGALIEGSRYGVSSDPGPVVNYATIIATGNAGGDYGVAIQGTGSVENLGTAALIEGYGGVLIGTDGTVTNAGTIESNQGASGIAIHFTAGDARLIDDPGAVFTGSIYGGHGGTAVLELTSSSGAGTISGLGSTVTNFTSLVFDVGAAWTVGGNDNANGLGTLGISGFTVGDTIDLNNFSAINRTFAANTLVLGDGIGDYDTLHIQGSLSAGNFRLTQAGNDTEVTFLNPPVVTAGGTVTFIGGGAPVALDATLGVTDAGSTTLVGATISFGTGFIAGDTLNFTAQDAITGSFSSGTLTLTGTDTLADYRAALDSITYSFTPVNGDPTGGGADTSRIIDWSVNDGTVVSNTGTSTLDAVHAAPTVTASGTVAFAGCGSPIALDAGFVVTDPDSGGAISTATISIGTGFLTGDLLNFSPQNGITGSYAAGTGILTLSGTSSIADYQAALESITYSFSPANGDPTHGGSDTSRIIDWQVTDGSSSNGTSNTGTSTVHTAAAPTLIYGQTIAEVGIVAATETVTAGVMTLQNAGGTTVGTINVGTSLVTNDFTLVPIAGPSTNVVVDTVFGTYTSGVTLLVNPTTIASTCEGRQYRGLWHRRHRAERDDLDPDQPGQHRRNRRQRLRHQVFQRWDDHQRSLRRHQRRSHGRLPPSRWVGHQPVGWLDQRLPGH